MLRIRRGLDDGGVLLIVALVLPLVVALTAGGFSTFVLYAGKRELQQVADQAALAAGAAIPPLDPKVLVPNAFPEAPFPLPSTDPVYKEGVARISELVPDPRTVACHFGERGLGTSAALVGSFRKEPEVVGSPAPGAAADAVTSEPEPVKTVCTDERVYPSIGVNPDGTSAVDCTNKLLLEVAEDSGAGAVQEAIGRVVGLNLQNALPALFTPIMRVEVHEDVEPPLLSFITGANSGRLRASAAAYRRVKNAVVVPIFPEQRALIDSAAVNPLTGQPLLPRDFILDPFNLNTALRSSQRELIKALDDADNRLDNASVLGFGLPCKRLLHNLRHDLRDIYDPPSGEAPTGQQLVDEALRTAQAAAGRVAAPTPDPNDPAAFPDAVASEAFVLVGVSVDAAMKPVALAQVPIVDTVLAVMGKVSDDECSTPSPGTLGAPLTASCYRAAAVSAANAYGAFRAVLVE